MACSRMSKKASVAGEETVRGRAVGGERGEWLGLRGER